MKVVKNIVTVLLSISLFFLIVYLVLLNSLSTKLISDIMDNIDYAEMMYEELSKDLDSDFTKEDIRMVVQNDVITDFLSEYVEDTLNSVIEGHEGRIVTEEEIKSIIDQVMADLKTNSNYNMDPEIHEAIKRELHSSSGTLAEELNNIKQEMIHDKLDESDDVIFLFKVFLSRNVKIIVTIITLAIIGLIILLNRKKRVWMLPVSIPLISASLIMALIGLGCYFIADDPSLMAIDNNFRVDLVVQNIGINIIIDSSIIFIIALILLVIYAVKKGKNKNEELVLN